MGLQWVMLLMRDRKLSSYLYIRVDCTNGLYSLKGRKHVRFCETAEGVRTISGLYKCCMPSMICITIEWA